MITTSDAAYIKADYSPPPFGAAIGWDNPARLRSVGKPRGIAEQTNATLVPGHDPDQVTVLPIAAEGSHT